MERRSPYQDEALGFRAPRASVIYTNTTRGLFY